MAGPALGVVLSVSTSVTALLQVSYVYAEPAARDSARGREILARFPDAELIEVPSHWNIPELHGNAGNVDRWVRVKAETLVLGVKKSLTARPNGRSSDFIAPSTASGCARSKDTSRVHDTRRLSRRAMNRLPV